MDGIVVAANSFRHNFQSWVDSNYGENSRTKTITRAKYRKICQYLLGQDVETDAKFRFWIKSKSFRLLRHKSNPNLAVLCVPVKLIHKQSVVGLCDVQNLTDYRQVAVVEDFFSIIRGVHINERGVHVGQKKTYRAVSGTYSFLPREAVSYFLMSCNHCKLRIQRSNSILVKHGIPPQYYDSDQEDLTDGEGSISGNDKEFEDGPYRKKIKRERPDMVYDDGNENGYDYGDQFDSSPAESEDTDQDYVPNSKALNRLDTNGNQSYIHTVTMEPVGDGTKQVNPPISMVPRTSTRSKRGCGGGRRLSYSPDTDKRLLQWVMERDRSGETVSRESIQSQALALIREESPDFKASSGWVEKFLIRHKLCLPNKATLENGVGKKNSPPPLSDIPEETNGTSEMVFEDTMTTTTPMVNEEPSIQIKTEPGVGGTKDTKDLSMAVPINRRGPARKRTVRDFRDEEEDEECELDDTEVDNEKMPSEDINPERLKAFNMFVRLFVDENLDRLVPISKQPKDKVLAIIHACQRQFPEFRDRARKRIRTYLKSCRRLKKLKEPLRRTADQINAVPSMSSAQMQEVNNILASACANEAEFGETCTSSTLDPTPVSDPPTMVQPARLGRPPSTNGRAESPADTSRRSTSSTVTSSGTPPPLQPQAAAGSPGVQRLPAIGGHVAPESLAAARAKAGTEYKLNITEVSAIRQLIASYRESAAFLYRSADELEALLPLTSQTAHVTKSVP